MKKSEKRLGFYFKVYYNIYIKIGNKLKIKSNNFNLDSMHIKDYIVSNINEMKLAEAGLQESQSFYRKVVQAAKLSTWEYNINDHTLRMSDDVYTQKTISILALPDVIENVPEETVEAPQMAAAAR